MDESIRVAFFKVKQDIDTLNSKINSLEESLEKVESQLLSINATLNKISVSFFSQQNTSFSYPTNNPTNPTTDVKVPTLRFSFSPLEGQNSTFSTGNEGVPTDRQTDQQTDQQTEKKSFSQAIDILGSLDNIKSEIITKFKKLTDQEFIVFSAIYQTEEEFGYTDYKQLSQRLSLTESSIRDYVGKLIQKGIPILKTKLKNKIIQLTISEKLRKITSLPSLLQLRGM